MRIPVLLLFLAMATSNHAESAPPERISLEAALQAAPRTGFQRLTHRYRGQSQIAGQTGIANLFCMQVAPTPIEFTHVWYDLRWPGSEQKPLLAITVGSPKPGLSPASITHAVHAREIPPMDRLLSYKSTEQFASLGGDLHASPAKDGSSSASWEGFVLQADGSIRAVSAQLFLRSGVIEGGIFMEGVFKPIR